MTLLVIIIYKYDTILSKFIRYLVADTWLTNDYLYIIRLLNARIAISKTDAHKCVILYTSEFRYIIQSISELTLRPVQSNVIIYVSNSKCR